MRGQGLGTQGRWGATILVKGPLVLEARGATDPGTLGALCRGDPQTPHPPSPACPGISRVRTVPPALTCLAHAKVGVVSRQCLGGGFREGFLEEVTLELRLETRGELSGGEGPCGPCSLGWGWASSWGHREPEEGGGSHLL